MTHMVIMMVFEEVNKTRLMLISTSISRRMTTGSRWWSWVECILWIAHHITHHDQSPEMIYMVIMMVSVEADMS